MYYVYIIRSVKFPKRLYIGLSHNIDSRIAEHNESKSLYTKKYAPWELEAYVAFKNKTVASLFEEYLKSGSGFAFIRKRMLPDVSVSRFRTASSAG